MKYMPISTKLLNICRNYFMFVDMLERIFYLSSLQHHRNNNKNKPFFVAIS